MVFHWNSSAISNYLGLALYLISFKPLSNDKFLDMTKSKAFSEDKLNSPKITISLCCRLENTLGKEENAGYQHFLLFPQCFLLPSS